MNQPFKNLLNQIQIFLLFLFLQQFPFGQSFPDCFICSELLPELFPSFMLSGQVPVQLPEQSEFLFFTIEVIFSDLATEAVAVFVKLSVNIHLLQSLLSAERYVEYKNPKANRITSADIDTIFLFMTEFR